MNNGKSCNAFYLTIIDNPTTNTWYKPSPIGIHTIESVTKRLTSALNIEDRRLFIKAWFLLGWMRAAILMTSFKRLTRSLEHQPHFSPGTGLDGQQLVKAVRIGKLVAIAARYTPWQSLCLVQVLVVQRLLAQECVPGQFYLGVRSGNENNTDTTGLAAHAWLQCGEAIVSGAAGHELFTVVSTFSWGTRD